MTRELALDVAEAVERAGGPRPHIFEFAGGKYGVSIGRLPDVARFMRALATLGVTGTVSYSAGTGWAVAERV